MEAGDQIRVVPVSPNKHKIQYYNYREVSPVTVTPPESPRVCVNSYKWVPVVTAPVIDAPLFAGSTSGTEASQEASEVSAASEEDQDDDSESTSSGTTDDDDKSEVEVEPEPDTVRMRKGPRRLLINPMGFNSKVVDANFNPIKLDPRNAIGTVITKQPRSDLKSRDSDEETDAETGNIFINPHDPAMKGYSYEDLQNPHPFTVFGRKFGSQSPGEGEDEMKWCCVADCWERGCRRLRFRNRNRNLR